MGIFSFRSKRYNVRGKDGKFVGGLGADSGNIRRGVQDISAVAEAMTAINKMTESQIELLNARDHAINERAEAIAQNMMGQQPEESDLFAQLLGQLVTMQKQRIDTVQPLPTNNQDETVGETAPTGTENQKPAEILKQIASMDDSLFTRTNIKLMCARFGLSEKDIKALSAKLHRVYK